MENSLSFFLDSHPSDQKQERPLTPVERAIYGIWASYLNRENIAIEEDFYSAGGMPELAELIAEEIRQVFLLNIPTTRLFALPTVKGQAACVQEARRSTISSTQAITQVDRAGPLALSYQQQRLWFFDLLVPKSALYNNAIAVEIRGALNIPALAQSLNEVIRRHETLRTTFQNVSGQPCQVIASNLVCEFPVIDLSSFPAEEGKVTASRLMDEEGQQPFDLSCGPLLRAKFIKLAPDHYYFLLSIHHIISDGWSLGLLVKELNQIYPALCEGKKPPLPDLPVQYVDFTNWQRHRLQGAFLDSLVEYWTKKLRDLPAKVNLSFNPPRPKSFTFPGASHSFHIPLVTVRSLQILCLQQDVTLFMLLLAALSLLIQRISGEDDFCIGTPIANRNRVEAEGLIGFLINLLPLRMNLNGNPTFLSYLQQVKKTTLEAYANQDMPFESLVEKLRPKRDQTSSPFFQVLFILANFAIPPLQIPGCQTHLTEIDTHTAKYDISLYVFEQAGGPCICRLEYNTDLFEADAIQWMSREYQAILERILGDPGQAVSTISHSQGTGVTEKILPVYEEEDREEFQI